MRDHLYGGRRAEVEDADRNFTSPVYIVHQAANKFTHMHIHCSNFVLYGHFRYQVLNAP